MRKLFGKIDNEILKRDSIRMYKDHNYAARRSIRNFLRKKDDTPDIDVRKLPEGGGHNYKVQTNSRLGLMLGLRKALSVSLNKENRGNIEDLIEGADRVNWPNKDYIGRLNSVSKSTYFELNLKNEIRTFCYTALGMVFYGGLVYLGITPNLPKIVSYVPSAIKTIDAIRDLPIAASSAALKFADAALLAYAGNVYNNS